jgi:hypothetical protein
MTRLRDHLFCPSEQSAPHTFPVEGRIYEENLDAVPPCDYDPSDLSLPFCYQSVTADPKRGDVVWPAMLMQGGCDFLVGEIMNLHCKAVARGRNPADSIIIVLCHRP